MRQQKITDILTFLRRSKGLEQAMRYGSSLKSEHNTVAEHSWRLGLMALVIGTECRVRVDVNHVLALALVHDLGEARGGDIDGFDQVTEGEQLMKVKAAMETYTMRGITEGLPFGDWIYDLWREYEEQKTVEAKFLKALDKIEGFLHIAEVGVENYVPKEFHADYADKAVKAFDEATDNFPGLEDFLNAIKADLKTQFEKAGVAWVEGESKTSTASE